jgi:mycothiol system anti-sigma-R factor
MISCSEAVKRLWDYLDDNLTEADRKAVDEHLSLCRRCCGELEFAEELRRFLQSSAREQIPADVRARLDKALGELEQ